MCKFMAKTLAGSARLPALAARDNRPEALLRQCLDRATSPRQARASNRRANMTDYADLSPSRRPWLIATPLVLVLVLAAVWSGVWYYAAREAEARINDWQAQQAKAGHVFSCASQTVGGLPFRIAVAWADSTGRMEEPQAPGAL